LLKDGIDARKDGLIWIIKALWLLEQDVSISCMPTFLDSESIKFLLEYGKMDIKRCHLHQMLKDLRLRTRKDRILQVMKQKSNNTALFDSPGLQGDKMKLERRLTQFLNPK
jgi:hypothetical protein